MRGRQSMNENAFHWFNFIVIIVIIERNNRKTMQLISYGSSSSFIVLWALTGNFKMCITLVLRSNNDVEEIRVAKVLIAYL